MDGGAATVERPKYVAISRREFTSLLDFSGDGDVKYSTLRKWPLFMLSAFQVCHREYTQCDNIYDAVMTNAAAYLTLLLWLSTQADINDSADHQGCRSDVAGDQCHLGRGSKSPRSSCKPLGSYLSCYDVDVPDFSGVILGEGGRPVELPVSLTAHGRPFRLRLRVDDLSDDRDGLKPEMAWSSVISSSTVVRVVGDSDASVSEYPLRDLGITWYVGHDDSEVAPSWVLASVVDVDDTQLFRAVLNTTSDIYYVQPAVDYPEVKHHL